MPKTEKTLFDMMDSSMGHNLEEKRAKREIANMNERRRMQNINAGFHSLRSLLPRKHDGEKLSKAAILQHTSQYIYDLENEVSKLVQQNLELKKLVGNQELTSGENTNVPEWVKRLEMQPPDCPSCKRRRYENNNRLDIDSSPINGDGSSTESSSEPENSKYNRSKKQNGRQNDTMYKKLNRLEKELQEERHLRIMLEDELQIQGKTLNGRRYPPAMEQIIEEGEVASESLEIEMQSCPGSPPEMIIASNEHITANSGGIYSSNEYPRLDIGQVESSPQQHRVQKQNAIALPIDVPFVAPKSEDESNIVENNNNVTTIKNSNGPVCLYLDSKYLEPGVLPERKLANSGKIQLHLVRNPNLKSGSPTILTTKNNSIQLINNEGPEQAKTSRQNLNTIVEAIRHLEGIKKEDSKLTILTAKSNDSNVINNELTKTKANIILGNISTNGNIVTVTGTNTLRAYQTKKTDTDISQRPQIIQRPNVIVANSAEN